MNLPAYLRSEGEAACRLDVWVQPGARRSELAGQHGERLKIKLAAPPLEGRANRLLTKFLAAWLGISPKDVELVSGAGGRAKSLRLAMPAAEVLRRLEADR